MLCVNCLLQCVVYSAWIGLQPDPAAAAGLSLQGRLLRSRSVVRVDADSGNRWISLFTLTPVFSPVLCRYGASAWHSHRLLRPPLAVVSDERAGESHSSSFVFYSSQFRVMLGFGFPRSSLCENLLLLLKKKTTDLTTWTNHRCCTVRKENRFNS